MPPRAKTPAPIDRPLSRAYLREFSGWATTSPPGLSEPSSLRVMENVIIKPDGAVAVRPALRSIFPPNVWVNSSTSQDSSQHIVGSFESFYLNDGRKAILFAVNEVELDGDAIRQFVTFKIAAPQNFAPDSPYVIIDVNDVEHGFSVPQGVNTLAFGGQTTYVSYVQIDNKIFALSNAGETMRVFYVGEEKVAKKLFALPDPSANPAYGHLPYSAPRLLAPLRQDWIDGDQTTTGFSVAEETLDTLVSSDDSKNVYNFGYFYTYSNEVGESPPSRIAVIKTQRRLSAWRSNADDDRKSPDQILIQCWWADASKAAGATHLNVYMMTWSDQEAVPVEAVRLCHQDITTDTPYIGENYGLTTHTPLIELGDVSMPLPTAANRKNYSQPSSASQGLVAGDRLVLVGDPNEPAVIRWSSNRQGEYTNFSSSVGGGYKTLTSGNLFVPAAVKLWQNPQSTDTITILCVGVDGYSTSYYMQPASVQGLSQSTTIMGFEETTATPGTVSPFGCEVLNNALYHPLDGMLMKSTASNYNINHKSMTDLIDNKWRQLRNKKLIISDQLDNKLYFLVDNPDNPVTPAYGENGNEIWVCDTANDGTWSRWLIPAVSLRKLEVGGRLFMAVVGRDSIYVLDDRYALDTVRTSQAQTIEKPIPWKIETNTQGANRAHDAWAHLQQISVTFGNALGAVKYGIRSYDMHGRPVDVSKIFRSPRTIDTSGSWMPWDDDDHLSIQKGLKEWRFFAESVIESSEPLLDWQGQEIGRTNTYSPFYGQISLVQYRYTPISVNVGYEYGSVETFEYGRSSLPGSEPGNTDNGIPTPMMDRTLP